MQAWKEIKEKFKDSWIAMDSWEEDNTGDVIKGNVIFQAKDRKSFYIFIKRHFPHQNLAIRFTGKISGPFFLSR